MLVPRVTLGRPPFGARAQRCGAIVCPADSTTSALTAPRLGDGDFGLWEPARDATMPTVPDSTCDGLVQFNDLSTTAVSGLVPFRAASYRRHPVPVRRRTPGDMLKVALFELIRARANAERARPTVLIGNARRDR